MRRPWPIPPSFTLMKIAPIGLTFLCSLVIVQSGFSADTGELLYNGIRLPEVWPPNDGASGREPMPVPYLAAPPAVIPIDVGRQLFVDDFLVEQTDLTRTFHHATPCEGNPVFAPEKPWEMNEAGGMAAPFSDGVWFDSQDGLFKMWYLAPPLPELAQADATRFPGVAVLYMTCLAVSHDGVHWDRPEFDVVPGTNVVLKDLRDSTTVWLDHNAPDPAKRFLLFRNHRVAATEAADTRPAAFAFSLHESPDGIHWSDVMASTGGLAWIGDRHTAFYNPFRKVWVMSIRNSVRNDPEFVGVRVRLYGEDPDAGAALAGLKRHPWTRSDRLDPHHPKFSDFEPQLYNLDAVAYESVMLGLFSILQGPENDDAKRLGIHKRNEVLLGFSRDGYHWDRPDRTAFLGVDETDGAWNWGNVQSAGGGCLVVGDRLYFYYTGRQWSSDGKRGGTSTGLAFLRRDGFASMDADSTGGVLTTRPVTFKGRHLFVNASVAGGELRAEVLDEAGNIIGPFSAEDCLPIVGDSTKAKVAWKGAADFSALAGKPVRFRFHLREGSLFAFWVSPDESGASRGFVAAGGPGFSGPQDLPAERIAGSKP